LPGVLGIILPLNSCRNLSAIGCELNYINPYLAGTPVCLSLMTLTLAKYCEYANELIKLVKYG